MPVLTTAAARLSLLVAASIMTIALAGCGDPAPETDEETARELGRDTDETVFDDTIQTQERARAVEDLTLGRKDDLDRSLEASEGDAGD